VADDAHPIVAEDRDLHRLSIGPRLPQAARALIARDAMTDNPATTYVVSVFEKPHWRTVLTTMDKQKASDMAKEIGDKVRIEQITPKPKKR
jgi:hypothetical protein